MRNYSEVARKFRALAHPMRLKLVNELIKGECCVGEAQKCLSISQPNVSQHLKVLKEAGIIISRREKNRVCYRASDDSVKKIFKIIFREKLK